MNALEGDAVLLGRRGLGEQLQQRVAVIEVHVLLDAVLLAQRQQHVRPAACGRHGGTRPQRLTLLNNRSIVVPGGIGPYAHIYTLNHLHCQQGEEPGGWRQCLTGA